MASTKSQTVVCTSIQLQPDERQLIICEKAALKPTVDLPNGAKAVSKPEIHVEFLAEANSPWAVGKEYQITIQ